MARGERDLRAQQFGPRTRERVERRRLGGGEQDEGGVERAGPQHRLGGGQRADPALRGVRGQGRRLLEERRRRGEAAARLRPPGRALQLAGHRLVGAFGRVGAVPRPAIGVQLRVGRLRERSVDLAPLRRRRGPVGGRSHERMAEAHPCADLDQARRLGRGCRVGADAEQLGGTPQQRDVADRLRRRQEHQTPGLRRQRLQPSHEALLDAAGQGQLAGQPEPAGHRDRLQPARQLEQRERVAAGLTQDPFQHPLVERSGDRRVQQQAGVLGGETAERELRQPVEHVRVGGLAQREDQAEPLRQQPARDEGQRLRRHAVEPLGVIDDADERPLLRDVGKQAEHCEADHEAIRRRTRYEPERRAQRVPLRAGESLETVEQRRAQRMQAGVRELHLGLDPGGAGDPAARRVRCDVLEQRCLAHARLAAEDEHPALAALHAADQPVQLLALTQAIDQPRRWEVRVDHARVALSRPEQAGGQLGGAGIRSCLT
jgi:hypothetical protein